MALTQSQIAAAVDRAFPWINAGIAKCVSRPVMQIKDPLIFAKEEPNFRTIRAALLAIKPDPNRVVPPALAGATDALQYIEYCVRDPWAEIYPLAYYYSVVSLRPAADMMLKPVGYTGMWPRISAAR